ncbi:hypothetical protein POM88_031410 [Heracleum sosnowskyi]|uniref:Uncharacterized protein n=1 Tax=Heracleum sosnowskyi TaxID=360622 RepID=A0AAD8HXC8_9APIA|nr:hypothetical protein POM88_031410 [Heracleum sosnowskyi]
MVNANAAQGLRADKQYNLLLLNDRNQGLSEEVRAAAACAGEEVTIRNRFSEMNAPKDSSSFYKWSDLQILHMESVCTFTLSNLGMFGVDRFDAILPPGTGAIIAIGASQPTVVEAVKKMKMVEEEKMRMVKKARLAVEACDQELKDKAKEVEALKMDRQRKKQHIDELDSIVRLKQAEADMFDLKASEARRELERIQRIILAKSEKSEEDYVYIGWSKYRAHEGTYHSPRRQLQTSSATMASYQL